MRSSARFLRALGALAVVGLVVTPSAALAASQPKIAFTPQTSPGAFDYGTVDGVGGHTKAQTFTLTNSGGSSSGGIKVTLAGSAAFTKTVDTCSGRGIGPKRKCTVTILYAPTTTGQGDTATLTAAAKKSRCHPVVTSLTLTGAGGSPNVLVTPGTGYAYDFGTLTPGTSATQTFTATNTGTGSTGSFVLVGPSDPQFGVSNNGCGGALAPTSSCQFDVTYTAPAACGSDSYHGSIFLVPTNTDPDYGFLLVTASEAAC